MNRSASKVIAERNAKYQRLFNTPDGKDILKELESECSGSLAVAGDPFATHVRVGKFEVIEEIKRRSKVDE